MKEECLMFRRATKNVTVTMPCQPATSQSNEFAKQNEMAK